MKAKARDLKAKLLVAALECSGGDLRTTFTFEELLVRAWKADPQSWGLRGFEKHHPDSERIHRELDSRGKGGHGLVNLGLLEKVQPRVYRLTPNGLATASRLTPEDRGLQETAGRVLESEIRYVLQHPAFLQWLKDPSQPHRFRDAGQFWGVAPGTPPSVIRQRIRKVEQTLRAAMELLHQRDSDNVPEQGRGLLFDRTDVERCLEFQATLKTRFAKDLSFLGVPGP